MVHPQHPQILCPASRRHRRRREEVWLPSTSLAENLHIGWCGEFGRLFTHQDFFPVTEVQVWTFNILILEQSCVIPYLMTLYLKEYDLCLSLLLLPPPLLLLLSTGQTPLMRTWSSGMVHSAVTCWRSTLEQVPLGQMSKCPTPGVNIYRRTTSTALWVQQQPISN